MWYTYLATKVAESRFTSHLLIISGVLATTIIENNIVLVKRSGESHFLIFKEFIIRVNRNDRRKPKAEHLVNKNIPFKKMFIIDQNGEKIGTLTKVAALEKASNLGLDLVIISDNPKQPVAKILDYGKFKYQRKKRRKEVKANQTIIENKEIRITPMIGIHDLETKAKKAREFLLDGHRVKISLKFRGRELARKDLGYDKHKEFFKYVEDIARIDKEPKMNGRNFLDMYLSRDKSKKPKEDNNAENENKISSNKED